jgi:SAM-dependent methyltransferase
MTIAPLRSELTTSGWPDALLAPVAPMLSAVVLMTECGQRIAVDAARWHSPATEADHSVIRRCHGRVLDIGSGPGRIVKALSAQGITALGIDVSDAAVDRSRATGAECVVADVFDPVPDEGAWQCALLLDGNIGIGGDPVRLLHRVGELVTVGGSLIVEVEPVHRGGTHARRMQVAHGSDVSAWFAWAVVSVDELPEHAARSGWTLDESWSSDDRWFTRLVRASATS